MDKKLISLLRECYNVLTNQTGLDDKKVVNESSLCRRIREELEKHGEFKK